MVERFKSEMRSFNLAPGSAEFKAKVAEVAGRYPTSLLLYHTDKEESIAESIGQYMINPTKLKQQDPAIYDWIKKQFKGKEYVGGGSSRGANAKPTATSAKPKRISAVRRGQQIEGVEIRSFATRGNGRALVLRADDGSERLVFESEVRGSEVT